MPSAVNARCSSYRRLGDNCQAAVRNSTSPVFPGDDTTTTSTDVTAAAAARGDITCRDLSRDVIKMQVSFFRLEIRNFRAYARTFTGGRSDGHISVYPELFCFS